MASGNTVTVRFAGEASGFNRVVKQVAENSEESAGRMGKAFDAAGSAADSSESKFMGMADLLDGLGGAFGLPTEGATNMMRSFGDLSGGFAILQPAIGGMRGAFAALNTTLLANPIFLVVAAIAALVAAFVIAYKNSETFRNIVNAVFGSIWENAKMVFGWIVDVGTAIWERLKGPVMAYVNFYRTVFTAIIDVAKGVFNAIARAWNNSFGKLSFSIPDIPGIPGRGTKINIPDIPYLAQGGIVTRPTLAMIGEAGPEAVVPLGRGGSGIGGSHVIINFNGVTTREAADQVVKALEAHFARGGAVAGPGGRSLRPA